MPKSNSNLSSLGKQIKSEFSEALNGVNEVVKDVARGVIKDVTDNTIVDTSKALSNWTASLTKPSDNVIEAHYKGEKGSTEGESQEAAILIANNAINQRKIGQTIFISNAIQDSDYIDNAALKEAESQAMDNAILAIAKAEARLRT